MNDKKISKFPIYMLFDRSSYMNSQIAKSFNTCAERLIFKLLANKQAQSSAFLGEIRFGKDAGIVSPLKPLFEFKLPGKLKADKGEGTDLAAALHIANSEIEQEYNKCTDSTRDGFRAGVVIFIAGRNTSSLASEILTIKKNSYMKPPIIFVHGKNYNEEALKKLSPYIYHTEDKIDFGSVVFELFKEEEKTSLINYEQNNNNVSYKEDSFQHQIDAVGSGGTLKLFPREFSGPSLIDRPMIIEGNNATVWALKGPVLKIKSDGVILRNLKIEATGEAKGKSPEDECALFIEQGKSIALENVEVKGSVIGLPGEEGIWRYPHSLQLGRLQPRVEHDFIMKIAVPVPCKIISSISGIEVSPRSLTPGTHEVKINIDSLPQDILISGKISIVSSLLKRDIFVNAHMICSGGEASLGVSGQVIWEPDDWSTLALGPELQEKKEEEALEAPAVEDAQLQGDEAALDKVPSSGGDEPAQSPPEDEKKVDSSAEPKQEPVNVKKEPPVDSSIIKPDIDEKPVISQNTRIRIKSGVPLGDATIFSDLSVEKGGINKEPTSQGSTQEKENVGNTPVPTDLFTTADINSEDKSQAYEQSTQNLPVRKTKKMPIPSIFQDMDKVSSPDEKPGSDKETKPAPEPFIQKKVEQPSHRFVRTEKIPDLFNDLWDDKKKDK